MQELHTAAFSIGQAILGVFFAIAAFFNAGSGVLSQITPAETRSQTTQAAVTPAVTDSAQAPKKIPVQTAPAPAPASLTMQTTQDAPLPPPPVQPQEPSISPEALNAQVREALVNIICTTQTGGSFEPISASGTIIDPRGVILTNAHVAQYFLLRNYPRKDYVECVVRTGSPARALYVAELLYLPPVWVTDNASDIALPHPTGTGENDYAFLLITGRTDPSASLPASFPYLPIHDANPKRGDPIFLAAYPAGFLSGINIETALYLSSAYATVQELYVFDAADQWIDLFSIPGTIVSQGGSSGGAAVRTSDGKLVGIIVTATDAATTALRDLRALSITHIEHSLQSQDEGGLQTLLEGDIGAKALDFNTNEAPLLRQKLIEALQ